ncbi:unnamed protein product [Dibothriocephalus latus]|uniref:Reverse transcriptase RNase H-like domain-containing protein n=1 Tax=Dibothriocephalus latus TaxID=60516 RepID=A0A3P7QI23_DIBLA|nr:unnamed protein product [Dibothriocephalus latus]
MTMDSFPPEVQCILALTSACLSAAKITQRAIKLMELHGFANSPLASLRTPPVPPTLPVLWTASRVHEDRPGPCLPSDPYSSKGHFEFCRRNPFGLPEFLCMPLGVRNLKLKSAVSCYSTFGQELLPVYLAVKHFRNFLEGKDCTVSSDQKVLYFAFKSNTGKLNPQEIRKVDYISQFIRCIHHIDRSRNEIAHELLRPPFVHLQLFP